MRLPLLCLILCATPVAAMKIDLSSSYNMDRPASIEFDPHLCGLWVVDEGRDAFLVSLEGEELRRIRTNLSLVRAITLEGDNLLVADGFGRFQRLTKDGVALTEPFTLKGVAMDTEGLLALEDGTLIHVEDNPGRLIWTSPDGQLIKAINTADLDPPLTEPRGIDRNPRTGNLLIVDDSDGSNSIFELTTDGVLVSTTPLSEFGRNPAGIAMSPSGNRMFMAFDRDARIATFDIGTGEVTEIDVDALGGYRCGV